YKMIQFRESLMTKLSTRYSYVTVKKRICLYVANPSKQFEWPHFVYQAYSTTLQLFQYLLKRCFCLMSFESSSCYSDLLLVYSPDVVVTFDGLLAAGLSPP